MGHLTSAYSCAEIVSALYYGIMRHDPQNPKWDERDRFILSKNHGSLMLYPILADLGYFPENELMTFMRDGTRLGAHSKLTLEGIDFAGGSLGIGLGVGAGLAYAAKMDRKDWLTFVLVGDGECHEGAVWEAAMFAAHNKLGNLTAIVDRNRLCVTDFTEKILRLEPQMDKWLAFGWEAREVNGHDVAQVLAVFDDIRNRGEERPLAIIADTIKGNGIDFMSNALFFHGTAPKGDQIERAIAQIEGAKE
jgi:transketolase